MLSSKVRFRIGTAIGKIVAEVQEGWDVDVGDEALAEDIARHKSNKTQDNSTSQGFGRTSIAIAYHKRKLYVRIATEEEQKTCQVEDRKIISKSSSKAKPRRNLKLLHFERRRFSRCHMDGGSKSKQPHKTSLGACERPAKKTAITIETKAPKDTRPRTILRLKDCPSVKA